MHSLIPSQLLKCFAIGFVLTPALSLSAATIHFNEDFESADLGGGSSATLPSGDAWTYNAQPSISYTVVDSTVQTPPSDGGDQILRFERTDNATSDQSLKGNFDPGVTLEAGMSVHVSFDAFRAERNAADTSLGDGFIFTLSDTTSAANFAARIDTLNNDDVRYRNGETNVDTQIDDAVDAGVWYRYEVIVNVSESGEITHDFALTPEGGSTQVVGSDIPVNANLTVGDGLRINLSPRSNNTLMYFDNFTVSSDVIPEPGSMSLMTVGALMMLRRRR